MTDGTIRLRHPVSFRRSGLARTHSTGTVVVAAALGSVLLAGACILDRPASVPSKPLARLPAVRHDAQRTPRPDPAFVLALQPVSLGSSTPLDARFTWAAGTAREAALPGPAAAPDLVAVTAAPAPPTAEPRLASPAAQPADGMPVSPSSLLIASVPLPAPRPPEFHPGPIRPLPRVFVRQFAPPQSAPAAAPAVSADNRSFLDRFFGMLKPSGPVLAYAAPDEGAVRGEPRLAPGPSYPRDQWTAVYEIASHTVYMPSGARLEAHSGLGAYLDDPRSVAMHDRGATPPSLYDLEPRAQLFHGVQALRLNPVGNAAVFGRKGLLAHTFMLGPKGDSNGCVSFRDYDAFLQAYQRGEVRRLVVVARLT